MKRTLAFLSSIVLIAVLLTSCQNNPTEPNPPEASPNEQISTDLQLAKPNGLDKQPVTALPYWARVEPPIPPVGDIGIPATDEWAIIYFYTQAPSVIPTDFNLLDFSISVRCSTVSHLPAAPGFNRAISCRFCKFSKATATSNSG